MSMVICSLAGHEEVCSRCPHAVPHEARPETYLEAACATEDLCLWTKAWVHCVEVEAEVEAESESEVEGGEHEINLGKMG